jgi:hypothetical protein
MNSITKYNLNIGENMKNGIFAVSVALLSTTLCHAGDIHIDGLGFTAPSITGSANVANPIVGDIVYDLTAQGFYGYNQSGSWVSLGPDANNTTITQLSNYSGVAVHGTNTSDNALAGYDGEFISSNATSALTPGASGTYLNVASINLSAGDWDVEGIVNLTTDSTWVGTQWGVQISTTSAASDFTTNGGINWNTGAIAASGTFYIPTGTRRISVAAVSTTVYLTAQLTYSTLGATGYGTGSFIRARRVR